MFNIKKLTDPEWYYRKYLSIISRFCSSEYVDLKILEHQAKCTYRRTFGVKLHLRSPRSLNEKLIWLSLYWRHPLKAECADKVKVRDYVARKGLPDILTPVLGIYDCPENINFESLPDSFVLKCNHGCAYNIVVMDKAKADIEGIRRKLSKWLSETYGSGTTEIHYRDIKPHRIICEKFLCSEEQPELVDYKIHCINGKPEYVQVCYDRDSRGIAHRASYSVDWQPLHYFTEPECEVKRPESLEKMISCAKILSEDFPYVRVDFYDVDGVAIMSELTFTPFGNMIYWVKDDVMDMLGKKLVLPKKIMP